MEENKKYSVKVEVYLKSGTVAEVAGTADTKEEADVLFGKVQEAYKKVYFKRDKYFSAVLAGTILTIDSVDIAGIKIQLNEE